jgi:tRNA pseudouridine32 synthase/23S rRNA pseudouridine746 synthase
MSDPIDELFILPPCDQPLEILHKDASFLLVNKPGGLLSVPGRHPRNRDSVIARLQSDYPQAAIVHRLDFDTSGIMVVPLGKEALSHISRQFQARSVNKSYTAVVQGLVEADEGSIDLPIAPDLDHRPKYKICHQQGKPSLTHYQVLHRDEVLRQTRLLLHPVTGRSHQLRLHLWAVGHPILGCPFYAQRESASLAPRLLLHATHLEFEHPLTGKRVRGESLPSF